MLWVGAFAVEHTFFNLDSHSCSIGSTVGKQSTNQDVVKKNKTIPGI